MREANAARPGRSSGLGRAVGLGAPRQLAREQHHAAVDDGDGCRLRVHGEHGDDGIGKQRSALPDERGVGEGWRRDGLDADAGIDKRLESGAQLVGGDRDVSRLSAPVAQRPRDDRISQRCRRKTAGRGAGFAAGYGLQISRGRRRQQEGLMAASQAPDGHRGAARQSLQGLPQLRGERVRIGGRIRDLPERAHARGPGRTSPEQAAARSHLHDPAGVRKQFNPCTVRHTRSVFRHNWFAAVGLRAAGFVQACAAAATGSWCRYRRRRA